MRGILLNVLTTHAFGAAFAGKAQLSHFSWIADGMRLDDTPGTVSMFERELSFASSILRKKSGGNGLVLYDELFHSTNPPDAIRTSEAFCNEFWKKENCISIVSTHVYSLARSAPSSVQRLCVAAWKKEDKFIFSYTIQEGICEVSSVELLLKQYSLAAV
jgi:DNA mismatch repair ATPase MutS